MPDDPTVPAVPPDARAAILAWYAVRGRPFAFRETADPYAILVSEAMAQQTQIARAAVSAGLPGSRLYGCSRPRTTSRASRSSGTSCPPWGKGCTRAKSPVARRSARSRRSSSRATASGSRRSCSARSSASLVTVGCVEYQYRAPSW